jgi:hypothetical protein
MTSSPWFKSGGDFAAPFFCAAIRPFRAGAKMGKLIDGLDWASRVD